MYQQKLRLANAYKDANPGCSDAQAEAFVNGYGPETFRIREADEPITILDVETALMKLKYPAAKKQVIAAAEEERASEKVVAALNRIPDDQVYSTVQGILRQLKVM